MSYTTIKLIVITICLFVCSPVFSQVDIDESAILQAAKDSQDKIEHDKFFGDLKPPIPIMEKPEDLTPFRQIDLIPKIIDYQPIKGSIKNGEVGPKFVVFPV